MNGIFYDPDGRRLVRVQGAPHPTWLLVTHDLNPPANHCRRVLREWVATEDLLLVDWSSVDHSYAERRSA